MTSLELNLLFEQATESTENLVQEDVRHHIIEDVPEFEDLDEIVYSALHSAKTSTIVMTDKAWAAESVKSKPSKPAWRPTPAVALPDVEDAHITIDDNDICGEPRHILLAVGVLDGVQGSIEFVCDGEVIASHGLPQTCKRCGLKNPIRMGTTEGTDSF